MQRGNQGARRSTSSPITASPRHSLSHETILVQDVEDIDIWIMDSNDVWTKVRNGVDPDSPILYAPSSFPKRIAPDVEAVVEVAIMQAPAYPIEDENTNNNDDEDE